jgi:hypothetical protein
MPTKDEADELQIPVAMSVLEIVRARRSGKDERSLEVTVYVIPSDRVEQVVVLERAENAVEPWPEPTGTERALADDRCRGGAERHGARHGRSQHPNHGRR